MAAGFNPKIVTKNLIFCLDAGNVKSLPDKISTATMRDLISNTTVTSARVDFDANFLGNLSYNGSVSNTTLPAERIPSGNQATVCIWTKINQNSNQQTIFRAIKSSGTRVLSIHLPWSDDIVYWDAGDSGTNYDRISKALEGGFDYTAWYYWVFTKNATTGSMKIYRNSEEWHSGTTMTNSITAASAARLGATTVPSEHHTGNIAHFSLYDRELTAEEVKQNFNATRGRFKI